MHHIKVSKKYWHRVKYNRDISKVEIQKKQMKPKLDDTQSLLDDISMQGRLPFQHSR
jgi:hypothetical protein